MNPHEWDAAREEREDRGSEPIVLGSTCMRADHAHHKISGNEAKGVVRAGILGCENRRRSDDHRMSAIPINGKDTGRRRLPLLRKGELEFLQGKAQSGGLKVGTMGE